MSHRQPKRIATPNEDDRQGRFPTAEELRAWLASDSDFSLSWEGTPAPSEARITIFSTRRAAFAKDSVDEEAG